MNRLSAVLLTLLLLGCGANQPVSSAAAPSIASLAASATPTASASATVTPSPSPTPAPTPPPSTITALRVVNDGLEVRKAPDGDVLPATLASGEIVAVVGAPVQTNDETWWHINVGSLDGWAREGTSDDPALIDAQSERSLTEFDVWAGIAADNLRPDLADLPPRVYVPNETASTVTVIDPATFAVLATLPVGQLPQHITPAGDMSALYVNNMASDLLSVIDPAASTVTSTIGVPRPYNLYFSPDGTRAIVMAEPLNRIDFFDPTTWEYLASIDIPSAGIDHADFSAGGRYLLAGTEFGGHVVKIDAVTMELVSILEVGGQPIDIKLSPDGLVFYVANQTRNGVSIIDPIALAEVGFLPTGLGAHGMAVSRDGRSLYVSNRGDGTISVIDFATRTVSATWSVGGSPDMLQVSIDGTQLWASNRRGATVSVIDTGSGAMVATIPVGSAPHGLTYFPQPGTISLGHNGVYR